MLCCNVKLQPPPKLISETKYIVADGETQIMRTLLTGVQPMRLACQMMSSRSRVVFALGITVAAVFFSNADDVTADPAFTVSSTDIVAGKTISRDMTFDDSECKGGNRSPQLSWRGAPDGTRSYAITLFDPDAPG